MAEICFGDLLYSGLSIMRDIKKFNFIVLIKYTDIRFMSGFNMTGIGFYTLAELSEYISKHSPNDFEFWLYVRDINRYKEAEYSVKITDNGMYGEIQIPGLAEFQKVSLSRSSKNMLEKENTVFNPEYHTGLFESLEQVKQYIDEASVIPLIQLGWVCYFKSSFIYDGVSYDYDINILSDSGKAIYYDES